MADIEIVDVFEHNLNRAVRDASANGLSHPTMIEKLHTLLDKLKAALSGEKTEAQPEPTPEHEPSPTPAAPVEVIPPTPVMPAATVREEVPAPIPTPTA